MTDADMIEAMARAIGPSFIGNRMPDMSGDPLRKATPYERRRIDEAVIAALAVVQPELDRLRNLVAILQQQAEIHAQEARTANATIYEAYQAVTGATGEPGNWNGARPIRGELDRLRAENARLRSALLDAREFVEVEHERREDSCLDADHEYLSEVYDLAAKIDAVLFPRAALSPSPADGEGR